MKLTVSLSYTQKATFAINDARILRASLEHTQTNEWVGRNEEEYDDDDYLADEVTRVLVAAGVPEDEFTIE
jgi:hypothetical protein